jgi:hypothetical protein
MRGDRCFGARIAAAAAFMTLAGFLSAHAAQQCDKRAFNVLVDEAAQSLRKLNRDSEGRFQDRLRAIGRSKGWTEADMASKAAEAMDDGKLANFNSQIEELVSQLDTLSATPAKDVSCDKLNELKSVRDRLITVMSQKSGFILAELEAGYGKAPQSAPSAPDSFATSASLPPAVRPEPEQSAPKEQVAKPNSQWSVDITQTPRAPASAPASPPVRPAPPRAEEKLASITPDLPPPYSSTSPAPPGSPAIGYTVQEIRDAGKGVFGTLTSEFAILVNYTFKKYGQPNAYVIGDEGGGAFLAGLRYGDGTLYTRLNGVDGAPVRIYWQGPSVGFDVGATGSRAMFLVYNLDDVQTLYKRFPGIDGSAYVAGGFGLTVFKSGNTLIVPIRTGLGLRLGASIAYLKFTERASLNPF